MFVNQLLIKFNPKLRIVDFEKSLHDAIILLFGLLLFYIVVVFIHLVRGGVKFKMQAYLTSIDV